RCGGLAGGCLEAVQRGGGPGERERAGVTGGPASGTSRPPLPGSKNGQPAPCERRTGRNTTMRIALSGTGGRGVSESEAWSAGPVNGSGPGGGAGGPVGATCAVGPGYGPNPPAQLKAPTM